MSEITITIPLSALGEVSELSPQGLANALQSQEDLRAEVKQKQVTIDLLAKMVRGIGSSLEQIVDNTDGYHKAKAIRELIQEAKAFKAQGESE